MGISILCLSLSRHHPKNLIQDRFIRERESSNHRGGRERENVRRSSSATDFSASYLPAHIFPGRFFYTFFPGQKKTGHIFSSVEKSVSNSRWTHFVENLSELYSLQQLFSFANISGVFYFIHDIMHKLVIKQC